MNTKQQRLEENQKQRVRAGFVSTPGVILFALGGQGISTPSNPVLPFLANKAVAWGMLRLGLVIWAITMIWMFRLIAEGKRIENE
ncbi:MAG: hypothetical protein AAGL69_05940 [Pseudomonadota bacterium]